MFQQAQIPIIPKLVPVFDFSKPYRYRGARGGRGSGKTRGFALAAALRADELAQHGVNGVVLCGREFMNSLEDSSMAEVKAAIESIPWLRAQYDIGEKYIRTSNRKIEFVFAGLRHNLDSIKSKSRVLIAWVDEAEAVSEKAWIKLLPTVREEGSEIWITWNPEQEGSPTDSRFVKHPPDNSMIVELNYDDNPFFPDALQQQRSDDLRRMDDGTYAWVWQGAYREESEAQIFAKCFEVAEFEPAEEWTLAQGLDWGFANDPTAAVRCYVWDKKLFISHEAVKVGLELDDTPKFITDRIPDFAKWDALADNARPESIRYVNRHDLPRVKACSKGKGSIEDGIAHIKSYDRVIIHPRCTETIRNFRTYSYKVDRLSGAVKPEPQDADNDCIDAIRYALEPMMRVSQTKPPPTSHVVKKRYW
jgi:phage terminase large subunit